jgi:hypothetical protein
MLMVNLLVLLSLVIKQDPAISRIALICKVTGLVTLELKFLQAAFESIVMVALLAKLPLMNTSSLRVGIDPATGPFAAPVRQLPGVCQLPPATFDQ